ncbi:MAG: polysaccharide deacetylase family protein [Solirubrobacteraceae bacterium]
MGGNPEPSGAGRVALTFDDGPDAVWTPRVLEALGAAGVRATFFVISVSAARHPELLADVAGQGHEIGVHCARHLRHTETPRAVIERDTADALGTLVGLGVRPTRWRVPWGACADWTAEVAREHDLELVGWSADTHDWRGDPASAMLDAVDGDLRDGAVVLMHDGIGPGAARSRSAETVRLVAPLCARIRARGCEPVSLASMAGRPSAW